MSYNYTTLGSWVYPPPPPPPPAGTYGLDIRQGDALDCYFVAALIAFAWSTPASLAGQFETTPPPPPPPPRNHVYRFREVGNPASRSLSTPETLAVDTITQLLVFARLAPPNAQYVWPGLYEKAYAIFRGLDADEPAIETLGPANPVHALNQVINAATNSRNTSTYATTTALLNDVKSKGGITTGKTTKPLVAWTYYDQAHTPGGAYAFTDDLIVANHTYAILGVTKVSDVDCIVLRNPYGISTGTAIAGISDCSPAWGPAGGFRISQGNFAITKDVFPRYFEGFAFRV